MIKIENKTSNSSIMEMKYLQIIEQMNICKGWVFMSFYMDDKLLEFVAKADAKTAKFESYTLVNRERVPISYRKMIADFAKFTRQEGSTQERCEFVLSVHTLIDKNLFEDWIQNFSQEELRSFLAALDGLSYTYQRLKFQLVTAFFNIEIEKRVEKEGVKNIPKVKIEKKEKRTYQKRNQDEKTSI